MFSPNQFHAAKPSPRKSPRSSETPFSKPALQNGLTIVPVAEVQVDSSQVEVYIGYSKKLQDDLKKLGLKIKHHEESLKFLKTQINKLDDSILDMQVSLGKYHSSHVKEAGDKNSKDAESEHRIMDQILLQEKTAAGILCQLKVRYGSQASQMPLVKDVLGIVAQLATVPNEDLSRLLSEYLGLDMMLAIVCKTYEGVKALEMYDREGQIDKTVGLHGLGPSIGRPLDGRFFALCLEKFEVYAGEVLENDPQRKLDLVKPRLPNGECPSGFLGFAVNMIYLDNQHRSFVTASGHGLRETLFYSLFSRLQVYKTRSDMQLASACITDGAISLDGAIIKSPALFTLGIRKDVEVRFAVSSGEPNQPAEIIGIEENMKHIIWEKERFMEDMQREQMLLQKAKSQFDLKREEFTQFITQAPTLP